MSLNLQFPSEVLGFCLKAFLCLLLTSAQLYAIENGNGIVKSANDVYSINGAFT